MISNGKDKDRGCYHTVHHGMLWTERGDVTVILSVTVCDAFFLSVTVCDAFFCPSRSVMPSFCGRHGL